MKRTLTLIAAAASIAAGTAIAQDTDPFNGFYVVAETGYENGIAGIDQFLYGGAAGVNLKLSPNIYVGVEGDLTGTSGPVDFTYGGHGIVGYLLNEKTSLFARAGYREFEIGDGFGSDGDYSLGLGTQYFLTDNIAVRSTLETVGFDTGAVRVGLVFEF